MPLALLTMSRQEIDRAEWMLRVRERRATQAQVAERLGLSVRQVERLYRAYKAGGAAAAYGLLALVGFFLVDRLFPATLRILGARGVTGLSDPAGLPAVSILFAVMGLLATPITNTFSRWQEADADHFSVEHFNEPDGLAKALVKTIEYRADSPSKLEEFIFYDHPSVGSRVRAMMDWKAAHPKPEPSAVPAPAPPKS